MVADQLRRPVPGGIGTYVRGLVGGLTATGRVELTLWAGRSRGPDPLAQLGADHVHASHLPSRLLTRAWDRSWVRPPLDAGIDVVHATSLAVPPRAGAPLSVMVHDLAWRHEPSAYPARGRRWHEAALGRAIDRADLLLTPSAASADDLLASGAPSWRVEVVEQGCDHLPPPDPVATGEFLAQLGLGPDRGYILTVSTLEPRKNLPRLIQAYSQARDRFDSDLTLLVVGPPGWGPSIEPSPGVVLAGNITSALLSGLYAQAEVMVSVPLREGFGLPAAEAMRFGVPVVASPMPSTGGAAHEVDPLDIGAIADAMVAVAGDQDLRSQLVAAGHRRCAELTWERSALRHLELWNSIASRRPA